MNNKPRILAIDDTPTNLYTLGMALAGEFDLQIASSGPEGLMMARESSPDLILLDVMMPGMDGFETCRRFKAEPALANTPIIFVTALSDLESELSGLLLGVADYITKPFKVELVKLRIRNILRISSLSQELKASEECLRYVMEATGEGVWDWRMTDGAVHHNASWCQILGLDLSFLTHPVEAFMELIHPEDRAGVQRVLGACLAGEGNYASEHRLRHTCGHYVWVADRGRVVERATTGEPLRMVGSIANITERKRHEAEIHHLAYFDALTELPNRRLLIERLQQAIIRNQRSKQFGALMFLDMDRFKQLNDTHGHAKGDQLLIEVGRRLSGCIREQDTVARLGGDEFVVMLEHLAGPADDAIANARGVGYKILDTLNAPYRLGELPYASTPSIGLTLFSGKEDSVDGILKRADAAMYAAKAAGRNTLREANI
ncbi:diguanylate cyclase domain-containing protein [Zoogloea sp.]|uniref:diguanylate cyclase domain-containing protein n=1 Tax=Zoogloea sp. TaxID=49181 RepID=UPI0035B3626E